MVIPKIKVFLFVLVASIGIIACQQSETTHEEDDQTADVKDLTLNEDISDSTNAEQKIRIQNFLNNPLDLNDYKKRKRGANSTAHSKIPLLYTPKYVGFYVNYFLFQGFNEHTSPHLIVYRKGDYAHGKGFGNFMEDRDTLVKLVCNHPDQDLKSANLVGRRAQDIIDSFGNGFEIYKNRVVYFHKNSVLFFDNVGRRKIRSFTYAKLDTDITSLSEIDSLFDFRNK